jgi:hypothetical protein
VAILFLHEELTPESLWRAGQCFEKANKPDQAKKSYEELVGKYPNSAQAPKSEARLKELGLYEFKPRTGPAKPASAPGPTAKQGSEISD